MEGRNGQETRRADGLTSAPRQLMVDSNYPFGMNSNAQRFLGLDCGCNQKKSKSGDKHEHRHGAGSPQ
jgi:hypothetical protein